MVTDTGADMGTDAASDAGFDAGEDLPVPPEDSGPTCIVPSSTGDGGYAATVEPIAVAHCAVAMCHDSVTKEAGMDLSAGHGYGALVCVPASIGCPGSRVRVVPGAPTGSVLWLRVSGSACYQQMPVGTDGLSHPLSAELLGAIEGWITDGALP